MAIPIARIDANKCTKEESCPAGQSCPIGAITRDREGEAWGPSRVDNRRCLGCGKCVRFCPAKAITVY